MSIAVVTGASSGIGLSLCKKLYENGFKVYGFCRSSIDDPNIHHIPCDITIEQNVKNAVEDVIAREGRIDVLVNNAGMGISGAVEYTDDDLAKYIFNVNFFGAFYCSKCVTEHMRNNGGGKIINISSVGSVMALPFQGFYTASKLALNGFFEALSIEVKPFNIQICTLLLGDIKTNFTSSRRKNATGCDVYNERIENSVSIMEKDEQNGLSPEYVTDKIARLCNKALLPHYKTIGLKYIIFVLLGKILPKRLVLYVIDSIYGGY